MASSTGWYIVIKITHPPVELGGTLVQDQCITSTTGSTLTLGLQNCQQSWIVHQSRPHVKPAYHDYKTKTRCSYPCTCHRLVGQAPIKDHIYFFPVFFFCPTPQPLPCPAFSFPLPTTAISEFLYPCGSFLVQDDFQVLIKVSSNQKPNSVHLNKNYSVTLSDLSPSSDPSLASVWRG